MPAIACREREHEALSRFLYERWQGYHSDAMFVFGSPGTGKTMSVNNLRQEDVFQFPTLCPESFATSQAKYQESSPTKKGVVKKSSASLPAKKEAVSFANVNCAALTTSALQEAVMTQLQEHWKPAKAAVLKNRATNTAGSSVAAKRISALQQAVGSMCSAKLPAAGSRKLVVLTLDEVDFTEQRGAAQTLVRTILAASTLNTTSSSSGLTKYCSLALIFISNCREKVLEVDRVQEVSFSPYTTAQSLVVGPILRARAVSNHQGGEIIFSKTSNDLLSRKNEGDARELRDSTIAAMTKAHERQVKATASAAVAKKEKEEAEEAHGTKGGFKNKKDSKKITAAESAAVSKRHKRNRDGECESETTTPVVVTVGPADVVAVDKCNSDQVLMLENMTAETLTVLCCCVRLVREKLLLKAVNGGGRGSRGGARSTGGIAAGGSGVSVNMAGGGNPRLVNFSELTNEFAQSQRKLGMAHPSRDVVSSHVSILGDVSFATYMDRQSNFELKLEESDLRAALTLRKGENPSFLAAYRVLMEA